MGQQTRSQPTSAKICYFPRLFEEGHRALSHICSFFLRCLKLRLANFIKSFKKHFLSRCDLSPYTAETFISQHLWIVSFRSGKFSTELHKLWKEQETLQVADVKNAVWLQRTVLQQSADEDKHLLFYEIPWYQQTCDFLKFDAALIKQTNTSHQQNVVKYISYGIRGSVAWQRRKTIRRALSPHRSTKLNAHRREHIWKPMSRDGYG